METTVWISNKIGSDDSNWSSSSIASSFTPNTMKNICDCFLQLDLKVKIKILLAVLEIPLHSIDALKEPIEDIVHLAEYDPDEWVRVAANVVKDYPTLHTIDKGIENITSSFQETVQNIKDELEAMQPSNSLSMVPLESSYLNRAALNQIVPNQPTPMKHFTLRRRPKSAELRAKITQKASDAANQRRASQTSTNSSKNLKRATTLPSNPLPSFIHSKSGISKTSLPKKTKLIDIGDQPLGIREQKKRKKVLAMEASLEEAKQRKRAAEKSKLIEEDDEKLSSAYAGGDISADTDTHSLPISNEDNKINNSPTSNLNSAKLVTPSYAVLPGSTSAPPVENPAQRYNANIPSADPNAIQNSGLNFNDNADLPAVPKLNRDVPSDRSGKETGSSSVGNMLNADPSPSYDMQTLQRELQIRMQQEHELRLQQEQQFNQQLFQQHARQYGTNIPLGAPGNLGAPNNMATSNNIGLSYQLPPMQNTHGMPAQPTQQTQRKKELSLTRDQMIAAQEMFRSANRVTRLEKELILGFMAGARENPFPNQGPVIIIKLSEDEEFSEDTNELVKTEMLFEMNYETGHWRRLKKTGVVHQQPSSK